MSRTRFVAALLLGPALLLTGCAQQGEVDRLRVTVRTLEEQAFRLQEELDRTGDATASQREQLRQKDDVAASLRRENQQLQRQLSAAVGDLEDIGSQISELGQGLMNPELQAALEGLAAREPGVFSYDPERGIIQLGSDVTFGSGSDQLQPEAAEALGQLAGILSDHLDVPFEVWVVGHTDSQPIGKSRDRHPTNMHLSVHRAISVRAQLVAEGLPANRVGVGGWGENRPVVAANVKGEAANRRVQIYLRPNSAGGQGQPMAPATPGTTTQTPAGAASDAPMK
jgi:chemotaxis protein MotB